jgi:phosphomannomutase/phosphoglucomutase
MQSIFREYDIRGIFEKELNQNSVEKIGYFLGQNFASGYAAIGYDARTHSPKLFEWLANGFNMAGCNVLGMGLVSTGINYFCAFQTFDIKEQAVTPDICVMITGSHNPPEYNGFKITLNKLPFYGAQIAALGKQVISSSYIKEVNTCGVIYAIDAKSRYINYVVNAFAECQNFSKKIVCDCGNGVAGVALPEIMNRLGMDAEFLFVTPDGTFPNHHPDPSEEHNLQDLKNELASGMFDLGFAFDGDADRIAVLTPKYNIKGDQLALIFARYMAKNGKFPTVIGEVKSSKVMYDEINKIGKAVMYKTGHSNLKMKIKEINADFAAEVSGHLFFNDKWFGFDDALYAAMRVIELIANGVDLDVEMAKIPLTYSTDEIKVKVTEESKFAIVDAIKQKLKNPPTYLPYIEDICEIDGVRVSFKDGWGLVRASNTTPILVTRFEAYTPQNLEIIQTAMQTLIKEVTNG